MLNDILTGRASLDARPAEQAPYRIPGETIRPCTTCGTRVAVDVGCGVCFERRVAVGTAMGDLAARTHLDERRRKATFDLAFGLLLLVVGIAITATTYSAASKSGGTYLVAYGPIGVGIIKLFRGLARLGSA